MKRLTLLALFIMLNLGVGAWADDWTPITPPNAPEARHGHSMVTLPDGRVMLFGGEDVSGHLFNDLHTFDDAWNDVEPANDPPPARRDHQAWVRNQQMYVSGGYGESDLLDDTWRYDIENNEWHQVAHSGPRPSPRYNHGVTTFGGDTYIFGGTDKYGAPLSDFWKLNADGSYTFLGDASYAFANPQLQISGDLMLVFGRPGMVAMYNFLVEQWGYFEGPPVGSGCTSARAKNAQEDPVLLLFGGQDDEGQESADVYEYNMATGEITQRDSMPQPIDNGGAAQLPNQQQSSTLAPGMLHSRSFKTSLDDLQMIFFGGKTNGTPTGNTYLYAVTSITPSAPSVTTTAISGITQTTADGGGDVWFDGGAAVTARGICWSTSVNPTIANDKTTEGSGTGSFTSSMAGLSPATSYHVRAYATNSAGTGYGEDVSFKTAGKPEPIPTLSEWGMIIFSFLLAGSVLLFLRRSKKYPS